MFEFVWPWIFLLAPLPWLARLLLPLTHANETALKVSFLDELQQLTGNVRRRDRFFSRHRSAPFLLIWLCLLSAAARPEWIDKAAPIATSGRDLLLALDVSGSMEYADMQWNGQPVKRLELVKQLFGEFIEDRHGDRIGLILFGSRAYLQSPLTFDRKTVAAWLREAMIGIAGNSTAIGDAIALGIKHLRQYPGQNRILVLITDGASNSGQIDPMTAARLAAGQQVKIYTIGIGADPGAGDHMGFNPSFDLDESSLRAIAEITGGQYFRARNTDELRRIEMTLDRLEPVELYSIHARPSKALYVWPLASALLLSLILAGRSLWPRGARS